MTFRVKAGREKVFPAARPLGRVRVALAILGLVLLLPNAAARLSMSIETPPPVMPLAGPVFANYTLTADCEPALPGGAPRSVHVWIARKPAWATIVVSPSTVSVDCASGTVEKEGRIAITATPVPKPTARTALRTGCAVSERSARRLITAWPRCRFGRRAWSTPAARAPQGCDRGSR
jgi:hypothetical protein